MSSDRASCKRTSLTAHKITLWRAASAHCKTAIFYILSRLHAESVNVGSLDTHSAESFSIKWVPGRVRAVLGVDPPQHGTQHIAQHMCRSQLWCCRAVTLVQSVDAQRWQSPLGARSHSRWSWWDASSGEEEQCHLQQPPRTLPAPPPPPEVAAPSRSSTVATASLLLPSLWVSSG